jgi:hypothetical protein
VEGLYLRKFGNDLESNYRSTLLKDIHQIRFPCIIELAVWGNNIVSVEGMLRIDMPHIQKIYLSSSSMM